MNNTNKPIEEIKKYLLSFMGKTVTLKLSKQRKKETTRRATIVAVYPHLFVVELSPGKRRMSFCYADLYTKAVEIFVA